ncbi:Lateral organ boundaries domain containing protein [Parasponia andersonii]|uniref:Lateral organ boundaries domain containing protein n=1 Tax=Parasponia andersonii TaxID=3476 RepID=A0A2P5AZ88_PARAD|nr:Lateral organ boundaries domain containing protein [Parasponia andersonii]
MSRDREGLDEIGKRIRADAPNNTNSDQIMGRRVQSFGPPGTLNTITPCAACKLLRRRCAEECPFSPYFSPQEPQKFAAVHKVFGASNVSKMLMELPESQRADAANSLVYEANLRLRDPVYGCMGLISALQQQIQTLQAELNAVRTEILRYKYREATSHHIISSSTTTTSTAHHQAGLANLVSPHVHHGVVSIASLPVPQAISHSQPPAPPPPPPPPPPSIVVSSSSTTSSTSSLYTPSTNTTGYSSISSDNVPYFD